MGGTEYHNGCQTGWGKAVVSSCHMISTPKITLLHFDSNYFYIVVAHFYQKDCTSRKCYVTNKVKVEDIL